MITLQAYRQQIGYFNQVFSCRRNLSKNDAEYIPLQIKVGSLKFRSMIILQLFILVASSLIIEQNTVLKKSLSCVYNETVIKNEARWMNIFSLLPNKYAKITIE